MHPHPGPLPRARLTPALSRNRTLSPTVSRNRTLSPALFRNRTLTPTLSREREREVGREVGDRRRRVPLRSLSP